MHGDVLTITASNVGGSTDVVLVALDAATDGIRRRDGGVLGRGGGP